VGFTPLEPQRLEPGSHTVRVRRPGFTEFDDVVQIRPGDTTTLSVDMMALAMVVTVRSTPEEARVFVDGTFRGNTPIEIELIEGEHAIRVTSPRYHEAIRSITAIPGQTDLISVELEPLPEDMLNPRAPEWYEEPLTWILIGGGAVVVGVTIALIAFFASDQGTQFDNLCGADRMMCDLVVEPVWTY
jgi:hypothetical protein